MQHFILSSAVKHKQLNKVSSRSNGQQNVIDFYLSSMSIKYLGAFSYNL